MQLISPNASFVGHLAGILVGLLYTMGPLKALVDAIEAVIPIGSEWVFQEGLDTSLRALLQQQLSSL